MATEQPHASRDDGHLLSRFLKLAAFPAAALSGYWVASTTILNSTYDRLKRRRAIFPQNIDTQKALTSAFEKAVHDVDRGASVDLNAMVGLLDKAVLTDTKMHLEKYGLGSTASRWRFIHADQRQRALLDGITLAGVTLGAMLSIANSRLLSKAFKDEPSPEAEGTNTPTK